MGKCEWCGKKADVLTKVSSLGTAYKICNLCQAAHESDICISCGETIIGDGSIKGRCYACSQADYEERQREAEKIANEVADYSDIYSTGIEMTEEDYERWVTFGQGNFTPEYKKRCRQNWIRQRLTQNDGWSMDMVESNIEAIEELMDRHLSKVIGRKYILVYYDGNDKSKPRIRQFVDKIGNVFIIEKKK